VIRRILAGLAVVAAAAASQTGVGAHHAITAVYDPNQPVTLDGVVTAFHYVNPHPFVEFRDLCRRAASPGGSSSTTSGSSRPWG
jgi:hypothetical protein